MDLSTKANYVKRNHVTVARQIDYVFKQLSGKVILSGLHPICQSLNFDDRREFPNRGTQDMHAPIHVVNAPKVDINEDSDKVVVINKSITCALPDETEYLVISN